jgi:ubiquinone/menaquinone biosynthesis C-methylase UbiE
MLGECAGLDILDLGCGDGSLSLQFVATARSLTLVDRSRGMLDVARMRTPEHMRRKVDYVETDLYSVDASNRFDVVLCIGVLAHVYDVPRVLDIAAGAVRPNGRCVLQISDADQLSERLVREYVRFRAWVSGQQGYATNRMTLYETQVAVTQRNLQPLTVARYALPLPGTGRLPAAALDRLALASWTRPRLSRHATDALVMFAAPAAIP